MSVKSLICKSIDVSKDSGVPLLLLGNPGIAKTTNVKFWAENNGYNIVTLIGSQRTPDEVLGYMVNDGTRLVTYTPDWYNQIIDSDKPTILFIDELSQATELTQGALLQLIFERKVGGNHKLPDDTLIISAANYSGNVPDYCTIQSAALNRFLIINLQYESIYSAMDEFLYSDDNNSKSVVMVENLPFELSQQDEICIKKIFKESLTILFKQFTHDQININNTNVKNLFNPEFCHEVYNIITGRTLHYLEKCFCSIVKLNLQSDSDLTNNIILGLIGAGTNSFESKDEFEDWVVSCCSIIAHGLERASVFIESYSNESRNNQIIIDDENISISDLMAECEEKRCNADKKMNWDLVNLDQVLKIVLKQYPIKIEDQIKLLTSSNFYINVANKDIESISKFVQNAVLTYTESGIPTIDPVLVLERVVNYYKNYI